MGAVATISWVWRIGRKLVRMTEQLLALLTPNGGESLADQIGGLLEAQTSTITWQQKADLRFEQGDQRFDRVERTLAGLKAQITHIGEAKEGQA